MSIVIDILIVLVLLGCLVHGLRRGFIGTVGSIAGLVAGGVAAWFVAPRVGALLPDATARIALALVVALVLVLVGSGLGTRLGSVLGSPVRRSPLGLIDRALGAAGQVAAGALVVSVIASLAVSLGTPEIARPMAESTVAQQIEALTPEPVAKAVEGVEGQLAAGVSAIGNVLPATTATL